MLQDHLYKNQIKDLENLLQRIEEWDGLDQWVIDSAISEWRKSALQLTVAISNVHFLHYTHLLMQMIYIWGQNDEVICCINCIFWI